jgi:arylsulfatase A-like enzyme
MRGMDRPFLNGPRMKYYLAALMIVLPYCASLAEDRAAAPRPNVLLILADDMGFSDLGCYGGEIDTPNLDALAKGGLRFTDFHNTARCWPSRACILTGYYAQQVHRDALPGLGGGASGKRPAWARLLPDFLRPLGYRSYYSGKWHIDGQPLKNGFDLAFDYTDTDRHFLPATRMAKLPPPLGPVTAGEGYYASVAEADEAIRQLRDHAAHHGDQPFFHYLAFTEPHFPLQAPPKDIDLYRDRYVAGWDVLREQRWKRMTELGIINCPLSPLDPGIIPSWNLAEQKLVEQIGPGEVAHAAKWKNLTDEQQKFQPIKMAIHAAMVHRMDAEIGRVIEQLKAMGALDNTVIFFVSDNGASAEQMIRGDLHDRSAAPGSAKSFLCLGPGWSSLANTPLRLHKSWVHEGGTSTPLIIHWPRGVTARGELRHDAGHLIDLAPTIVELGGGKWPEQFEGKSIPRHPGESLIAEFSRDGALHHELLWWFHDGNRAIRVGNWKLVADHAGPWELYDMQSDRSESTNLASHYPEKVKELEATWKRQTGTFQDQARE